MNSIPTPVAAPSGAGFADDKPACASRTPRAEAGVPLPREHLDVVAFLRHNPALAEQREDYLDLAYDEYRRRRLIGEHVDPKAFCERFPGIQRTLYSLIQADQLFQGNKKVLAMVKAATWPKSGQAFQDYVLGRELGRGAFAQVFLAHQPALGNRLVVVKVSSLGTTEAATQGRLNHRNIVPVHSVTRDEATRLTTICMPYLGHGTLADVLGRLFQGDRIPRHAHDILRALPKEDLPAVELSEATDLDPVFPRGTYVDGVLHLAIQLAEALAFIHHQGICHRDLKPANVLVTPTGKPMLLDFNVAWDVRSAIHRTGGTLPYMSAEQIIATDPEHGVDSSLLDERSDLYSLGVILFELLTGVHPFGPFPNRQTQRERRNYLLKRQREGPRSVRQFNRQVDRLLARTIESCVAYNPRERPQTADELAALFRKCASWSWRSCRWLKSHPRLLSLAAALLVSSATAAGTIIVSLPPPSERLLQRGLAAYQQGQYQEAVHHLGQSAAADAHQTAAPFWRARAYQNLGNYELALADYRQADLLQPSAQAKAGMGYCLGQLRKYPEAATCNREAIQAGLDLPAIRNNLAHCLIHLRQFSEAEKHLASTLAGNPSLRAPLCNRALLEKKRFLLTKACNVQQGLEAIGQAMASGPPHPEVFSLAAFLNAVAAQQDDRWTEPTLTFIEQALALGQSIQEFRSQWVFRKFLQHPRWPAMVQSPPPTAPPPGTFYLVDPFGSSSDPTVPGPK